MAEAISFVRSDEQAMLASTVRELLESTSSMDAVREMSLTDDAFDRASWSGLAEMGVIGMHIPEEFGGAGYGFAEMAIIFEELGRQVVPVPLLSSVVASVAILEAGDDDQCRSLLPAIASGSQVATLACFEDPHDDARCDTSATAHSDGWHIAGTKRYVTDAVNADMFIVSARVDSDVGLFAVPADSDGVEQSIEHALDATRPIGDVTFDTVVDESAYLGRAPNRAALQRAIDTGVTAMAQEQAGGAQRCLEMAVAYAGSRYQFGRAIGSFQAVKHMCADMLVATEHAKSAAWHAARTLSDPVESAVSVPLAKSVCSDAYLEVAGAAIQVFGGIGFTWEHDVHLYFKRAKATSLLFGSIEAYRDRLGDAIGV